MLTTDAMKLVKELQADFQRANAATEAWKRQAEQCAEQALDAIGVLLEERAQLLTAAFEREQASRLPYALGETP